MTKVAVLTVNYNSENRTIELMESLKISSEKDFEIYIVDNASSSDSIKRLKNYISKSKFKIELIENSRNVGWGLACNQGFKLINKKKVPYVFVVNNDVRIGQRALEYCINVLEKDSSIGICGVKILNADGSVQTNGGIIKPISRLTGILFNNDEREKEKNTVILRENEFIDDCAWMIRTEAMRKSGRYPNYLFLYFEELYIVYGVRKAGYFIAYNPSATVKHINYGSSGDKKNPIPVFYLTRNRFIFMKEFYPLYFPVFLFNYFLAVLPITIVKYYLNNNGHLIEFALRGIYSGILYLFTKKKKFLFKEGGRYIMKEVA